jgi:hypothetical protein
MMFPWGAFTALSRQSRRLLAERKMQKTILVANDIHRVRFDGHEIYVDLVQALLLEHVRLSPTTVIGVKPVTCELDDVRFRGVRGRWHEIWSSRGGTGEELFDLEGVKIRLRFEINWRAIEPYTVQLEDLVERYLLKPGEVELDAFGNVGTGWRRGDRARIGKPTPATLRPLIPGEHWLRGEASKTTVLVKFEGRSPQPRAHPIMERSQISPLGP